MGFCNTGNWYVQINILKRKNGRAKERKRKRVKKKDEIPFKAITLVAGFIIAESAVIGLRIRLLGSFISIITT